MIYSPSMPSTKKAKNSNAVRCRLSASESDILICFGFGFFGTVSRLYAHSKNYDMDLTLDYNTELFPLITDQSFALALASSLARGGSGAGGADGGAEDADDKDRDVWRPDGKGRRGLEEDYDYVMYGKVSMVLLHFN
jgi:hypothetical protein